MAMRTFIAVEIQHGLADKIYEFILKSKQQIKSNKISWVKKENLHITLKFLGEASDKEVEVVRDVLNEVVKNFSKFSFFVKDIGVFPNIRNARVIWLGIEDEKNNLSLLSKIINEELLRKGLQKENKDFVSHITIGRIKNLANSSEIEKYIHNNLGLNFGENTTEFITFFQSILKPEGPIYLPIEKFYLKNL